MSLKTKLKFSRIKTGRLWKKLRPAAKMSYKLFRVGVATLLFFYFSLIISSNPVHPAQSEKIERAIKLLEDKGFGKEAVLLRNTTLFRNTDNWLNNLAVKENAFASTNCPFGIITTYPDFYQKTKDDTERAMILLHEVQHLQGADERQAYSYVWRNRQKLGWTIMPYGSTETFVTIELQTREFAPELFSCPANLWNDCTENLREGK